MLPKLLYCLRYGSIRSLIVGWRMSSCPGLDMGGPVKGGAKAGVSLGLGAALEVACQIVRLPPSVGQSILGGTLPVGSGWHCAQNQ